jgi:hypothetical protein
MKVLPLLVPAHADAKPVQRKQRKSYLPIITSIAWIRSITANPDDAERRKQLFYLTVMGTFS